MTAMLTDYILYLDNKNWISFCNCVLHRWRYRRDQGKLYEEIITCAVLLSTMGMPKTG